MLDRPQADQSTSEVPGEIISNQQTATVDMSIAITFWEMLANDYISLRAFFQLMRISRDMRDLLLDTNNQHNVLRSQLTLFPANGGTRVASNPRQTVNAAQAAVSTVATQNNLQIIERRIQSLLSVFADPAQRKRVKSWLLFDDVKAAAMLQWEANKQIEFLTATVTYIDKEPNVSNYIRKSHIYNIFSYLAAHGLIVQLRHLVDSIILSARQGAPDTSGIAALRPYLIENNSSAFGEATYNGQVLVVELLLQYVDPSDIPLLNSLMFFDKNKINNALVLARGRVKIIEAIKEVYLATEEGKKIFLTAIVKNKAQPLQCIAASGNLPLLISILELARLRGWEDELLIIPGVFSAVVISANIDMLRLVLETARSYECVNEILRDQHYKAFRTATSFAKADILAILLEAAARYIPAELGTVLDIDGGEGFTEAAEAGHIATLQLLYRYTEPGQPHHYLRAHYETLLNDYPETRRQLELAQSTFQLEAARLTR